MKLYSVADVAAMLCISESKVYELKDRPKERGGIECYRFGSAIRFSEEMIQDFLERSRGVAEVTVDRSRTVKLKHLR